MYFQSRDYSQLIRDFKRIIEPIFDKSQLIVIHGSVTENKAKIMSDIDLIIVAEINNKMFIKDILSDFSADTGIPIDLFYIPESEFDAWKNHPLLRNAIKNGVIIWNQILMIG